MITTKVQQTLKLNCRSCLRFEPNPAYTVRSQIAFFSEKEKYLKSIQVHWPQTHTKVVIRNSKFLPIHDIDLLQYQIQ